MSTPQVRAADIGYGNSKYVRHVSPEGVIVCSSFPSVAPQASANSLSMGVLGRRKTVTVEVNNAIYEVGEDSTISRANHGRTLDTDYCLSDVYSALLYGAFKMMNVDELDMLVLGLPVSTYSTHRERLAEKFKTRHSLGGGKSVVVNNCLVVPQPIGGFYSYAIDNNLLNQMKNEVNLLLDPGFFTFDWLVTNGTKPIDARCGAANNGGMAEILTSIKKAVEDQEKKDAGDISRIDNALRNGTPYKVHGKEVDLTPLRKHGEKVAMEAINKMVHNVASLADIDNVIVVGGGAEFFKPLLEAKIHQEIRVVEAPLYANCRGFQYIGEELLRRKLRASEGPLSSVTQSR